MSNRKKITLAILVVLTVVLAAVSIYVTIRLQENQSVSETGAFTNSGFTNACGRGIQNPVSQVGSSCNAGCGGTACSGAAVKKFTCTGKVNECGNVSNGGATPTSESAWGTSQSIDTGTCGITQQIDVFPGQAYTGLKDYIVYYTGECTTTPPNPTCPSSVQARFRLTVNGVDVGLKSSGSFQKAQVSAIDYTVVTNMQTNPPSYFNGTVTVTGPNGYSVTNNGSASPKPVTPISAGTYTLSALVNGSKCDGATITITDVSTTCYRCSLVTTDANTCENQVVTGTSCPTGWTTNSNCAAAATGGACPVDVVKIQCYRCTTGMTDGNACENQQMDGPTCPTGWTSNSNCAAAATGGACPVVEPTVMCYRCTAASNDANACESQTFTGQTTCPTGWTSNSNCAAAATGGACPVDIPQTTCYKCTVATNDGNACESQIVSGTSCPSGYTTNSTCSAAESGGACPVDVTVACGASCGGTNICAAGHTCNSGICKLDACLTPGNCSDACTPIVPVCGGSCTSNAQCPNGHTCSNNKCILNGCTDSTCIAGCTVIPVIPNTGIVEDARLLIIGSLFIAGGYISIKLGNRKNLFSSLYSNATATYEDKAEKKLKEKAER